MEAWSVFRVVLLSLLATGCAFTPISPECRAKWPISPIGMSHHVAAARELEVLDAELECERERRERLCRPPRVVIEPGASLQAIARAEQLVDELVRQCEEQRKGKR